MALAVALALSALSLFLLHRTGNLQLAGLPEALSARWSLVVLSVGCQVAVSLTSLVRYRFLLGRLGVRLPFGRLVGPTFVAQAVGTWLPASMAVSEALRLALMFGLTGGEERDRSSWRARIALASLVDRTIGQGAMLLVGSAVGFFLLSSGDPIATAPRVLFVSSVLAALGGVLLLALPFLVRAAWIRQLLDRLSDFASRSPQAGLLVGLLRRVLSVSQKLVAGAADLTSNAAWLVVPSLLSAVLLLISCLTLYLPGLATPHPTPLTAILVGVPLLSLSLIIPLGFAGVGSQQFLALGVFSMFAVDGASLVTASLVQNALALASTTLLGGLAALFLFRDLRALRRARAAPIP